MGLFDKEEERNPRYEIVILILFLIFFVEPNLPQILRQALMKFR